MKKILSILGAITLSSTTVGSVVSCGLNTKDWHEITVGIVNNGKDKSEVESMKKAKAKFDEMYGDLGYKIKFEEYIDENVIPKRIQDYGNSPDIPDVFFPTVDMTSQLASAGMILALEGINSPWQDSPTGGASILTNLHYNKTDQTEAEKLLKDMNDAINAGKDITDDIITQEVEWNTFLPYAIEASKFQSINVASPDVEPVQYGITKHVGVGGGSAIINNETDKFDQMYAKLNLIPQEKDQQRNKDGSFNWLPDAKVSIKELVDYMLSKESEVEGYKQIYTLVDRGMWWMYPLYANAIPDIQGKEKKLAAAKIGVNWLNGSYKGKDSDGKEWNIDDSRGIKYTSIFGNQHYTASTKELIQKWFELYGAMVMNAKYDLDKSPNNPGNNGGKVTTPWNYKNLFDVKQNNQVQANLLNNGWAAGINYEPGSYFDMLNGFKLFSNMDYTPLGKIEIFDHETEKDSAEKYIGAGLNTWLTPAGSGQAVFNRNLINPSVDPNMEKAEAAMRFVETTFGFYRDTPDAEAPIVGHGDGGIRNLKDQFSEAGDNPVQLAVLDKRNQDDKFEEAMQKKVKLKFNRAKDENEKTWWDKVKNDPDLQNKEKDAIYRLEVTSIQLAADLYRQGGDGLSLAPNRSAFDEAGPLDYHGRVAMQPALLAALDRDDLDDWDYNRLKNESSNFAYDLMKALAKQDQDKSKAVS